MDVLLEESVNSDMFAYATVVTEWILELSIIKQMPVWLQFGPQWTMRKMHVLLNAWVEDSVTTGLGTVNSKLKKKVRKSLNPFLLSL